MVAIAALAIGGAKVASDHAMPGSGFSTVQTAAADPTGPGGPTGGPGMDGGQQFQPPQMPSSMPDYQGGNNQPPLNQDNGVSIYNTGSPGAQQVPGQQAGQQPQQAQQPAHGTQPPNYQTATPFTQGPGQANPDYQAPQQGNQPQQGQQPQQQQPSQAPTQTQQPQNKQDDSTQQLDQKKQQCQAAAVKLATTAATTAASTAPVLVGGGGRSPIWWFDPKLEPAPPTPNPNCPQGCSDVAQKPSSLTPEQREEAKQIARDEFARLKQEEKDKFPWEKIAEGAVVGCGTGAVGGAVAGLATAGVLSGPGAAFGCVGGSVTGVVGAIGVWAFGQWTNNMKPMN